MKILYLDCSMGASGDMLTSALSALLPDYKAFADKMNSLGIPGVHADISGKSQYGVMGLHTSVKIHGEDEEHGSENHGGHGHHHGHSSLKSVKDVIFALPVSDTVKNNAAAVYELIAEAEGRVHGEKPELVHFHEVGALDAVADVAAVCLLMEMLGLDGFYVSAVNVGGGSVKCAHGILPVPAPATAELLKGSLCYGGEVQGELCTPTGAALIRHFAKGFGNMPPMIIEKTGVGVGSRDFGRANILRAFLGESGEGGGRVAELCCNIDDMSAEALGFAMERLLDIGAADVFFTPIYMKKNRPAYMLSCICAESKSEEIAMAMLKYTSTLGVRRYECSRTTLERRVIERETSFGRVRFKQAEGFGIRRTKAEYEDIKRIAEHKNVSMEEALKLIENELG